MLTARGKEERRGNGTRVIVPTPFVAQGNTGTIPSTEQSSPVDRFDRSEEPYRCPCKRSSITHDHPCEQQGRRGRRVLVCDAEQLKATATPVRPSLFLSPVTAFGLTVSTTQVFLGLFMLWVCASVCRDGTPGLYRIVHARCHVPYQCTYQG